jgi:hypothetical protein
MQITATCHIRNRTICLNQGVVYHRDEGDLDDFLNGAYDRLKIAYPRFYKMDRLSKTGFLAAEVLLAHRSVNAYKPDERNIVLSNASASLDTDVKYLESSKNIPSPSLFVYTLPSIVAGEICIRNEIKGENAFFISQQFDAELMEAYVSSIMDGQSEGDGRACLAGWVEVFQEQHDVFLYLVENSSSGRKHSARQLMQLYHQ